MVHKLWNNMRVTNNTHLLKQDLSQEMICESRHVSHKMTQHIKRHISHVTTDDVWLMTHKSRNSTWVTKQPASHKITYESWHASHEMTHKSWNNMRVVKWHTSRNATCKLLNMLFMKRYMSHKTTRKLWNNTSQNTTVRKKQQSNKTQVIKQLSLDRFVLA